MIRIIETVYADKSKDYQVERRIGFEGIQTWVKHGMPYDTLEGAEKTLKDFLEIYNKHKVISKNIVGEW